MYINENYSNKLLSGLVCWQGSASCYGLPKKKEEKKKTIKSYGSAASWQGTGVGVLCLTAIATCKQ
jgi:hypothetical protein